MGPKTGAVRLAEQCDTLVVEELRRAVLEMTRTGGAARLIWCFGPDQDPIACNLSNGSAALRGRSVGVICQQANAVLFIMLSSRSL